VSFSAASVQGGSVVNASTQTDSNGLATAGFNTASQIFGSDFLTTDVNASTSLGSVDFLETTYQLSVQQGIGIGAAQIYYVAPKDLSPISAGEGDVLPNVIVAQVFTGATTITPNSPIPNIGMRIVDPLTTFNNSPVASCQNNALSDNSGLVHCDLKITCQAGLTSVGIQPVVGELIWLTPLQLNIVPGSSRTISKLSGDNQTGNVGQTLGQVLVATVTDNCGKPVSGAQVTWQVTGGSATLASTISTSNSAGQVSTKVVLGQIPGTVTVTTTIGTATVTFTATNNVTVGSLTLVSGGGQTAITGAGFAQPLIFVVKDTNSNPVPGVQVNFSIVSGSVALGAASATTNTTGQASVTVTAGATPGAVTIRASFNTFNATASLTVQPPGPVLTSSSFTNAASGKTGLVACGIATATGSGLASVTQTVYGSSANPLAGPLPTAGLAGLSLTVGGLPAPIYWISPLSNGMQAVTFQTPCEVPVGPTTVNVTTGSGTTPVAGVQVLAAQPGIFTYAQGSTVYGSVIRPDGSYVSPSNYAVRGETDYLVATGLGLPTPAPKTGSTGNGETIPLNQVLVAVGGNGEQVVSVQYVPGAIGVYYIGFQLTNPNLSPGPNQALALWVCTAACGTSSAQYAMDNQGALFPGIQ
jgi:uncharacterized protein (TIGR03437 family)